MLVYLTSSEVAVAVICCSESNHFYTQDCSVMENQNMMTYACHPEIIIYYGTEKAFGTKESAQGGAKYCSDPKMAKSCSPFTFLILTGLAIIISLPSSSSQPLQPPNIAGVCNGILISYIYNSGFQLPPIYLPSEAAKVPYRFQSTLFLQNTTALRSLNLGRSLFNMENSWPQPIVPVLADGILLPADVSNGTVFARKSPDTDLKTAIQTGGDFTQMQARV